MTLREAFESLWATLHDIANTNVLTKEEMQEYAREGIEDFPHAKKYDGEL